MVVSSTSSKLPKIYTREEHRVSRRQIDPDALKIMYRLLRSGFKAYLVGGGVRDLLLGIKPKDFDIGTDARPNQIRGLFRNSRIIGRRFRLVHIFFKGNKIIEVATFRAIGELEPTEQELLELDATDEVEEGKRIIRSENVFGTDETDAFRRDLTINALFYDLATFAVIDYVGGYQDLRNGVIRVIGEPDTRFREDPVRLFRTVRHAARTGFQIEAQTRESLLRNRKLLLLSPPMRIFEEFKKDFKSGCSLKILRALAENTLLELFLPELTDDGARLLRSDSQFSLTMQKVDSAVAQRVDIAPTVILGIIALYAGATEFKLEELKKRFKSEDELLDHLAGCFPGLSVPRKERERIANMLSAWFYLGNIDLSKIKPGSLARKPYFNDLASFVDILEVDHESPLLTLIDAAKKIPTQPRLDRGVNKRSRVRHRNPH